MAKSVEDQLADNAAAIEAVEQRGARVTVKDREIWRAPLGELEARAERLEKKVARQKRGGLRVQRIIPQ
ncbi:hypothetical protein [Methylobacterium sp. WCS2018Hpa-22]|uniref:hypothetical protein n=1 Tax=Methylobacterium sp. WCS2018Hpa-22 TaxID=3073633 RepID=UPI00288ACBFD|nr:hypothetical protein [Methylobacterium sp. WCS2018Hpa-22]